MKILTIKANSRAAIKIFDNYFTVEYAEERSVDENDNIEVQREDLWETVNAECDDQVQKIIKTFKKKDFDEN